MRDLFSSQKTTKLSAAFLLATALAVLAGCSDNTGSAGATTTTTTTTTTAASIQISGTPTTVKSDGSTTSTITVFAVDANNAMVSGTTITLSADTGLLDKSTVTTDATGTATVTFSSGTANKANRTASITATAGTVTKTLLVPITGSTLTLATAATSINTGTAATLTATVKDAGGNPVSDQTVSFTVASGSGTLSVPTATTNASGVATTDFTATAAGAVSVKADWLDSPTGASTISATQSFTAATVGTAFGLITPASSPFAVTLGTNQTVTVYVPATILATAITNVRFTTSLGGWLSSGTKTQTVAFGAAGPYTETFVAGANAGNANVQIDALNASGAIVASAQAVLSLSASAASASTISLQANVTSISPSTGGTSSTATLTAMVRDANGNPVGNAPVLFELINPSGSGEQVTPVTVMTAVIAANGQVVGQAQSTYIAGTLPTTQASMIKATVIGTAVSSTTTITVGGTAGSIAIGTSTKIASVNTDTTYQLPVTVLVTDSNGNAVSGATVSLSLWATNYLKGVRGALCAIAYDGPAPGLAYLFPNEDSNENLILDAGEDVDGPGGHAAGSPFLGIPDGVLWPQSSAAGSVPQTVITGTDGTASFNVTYLKDYASWLKVRLRARTVVQGTEATTVYAAVLPISAADASTPCHLSDSPFN